MSEPTITILPVYDSKSKIQRVIQTTQQHFLKGDSLIIFVPNKQAEDYVNDLLWKQPQESFIPHCVSNEPCSDRIVITQQPSNLNSASVALNLTAKPCQSFGNFEQIYELKN